MTTEEIEIAIQRSGTAGDENMVMSAPVGQSNVGMMAAQPGTGAVIPAGKEYSIYMVHLEILMFYFDRSIYLSMPKIVFL